MDNAAHSAVTMENLMSMAMQVQSQVDSIDQFLSSRIPDYLAYKNLVGKPRLPPLSAPPVGYDGTLFNGVTGGSMGGQASGNNMQANDVLVDLKRANVCKTEQDAVSPPTVASYPTSIQPLGCNEAEQNIATIASLSAIMVRIFSLKTWLMQLSRKEKTESSVPPTERERGRPMRLVRVAQRVVPILLQPIYKSSSNNLTRGTCPLYNQAVRGPNGHFANGEAPASSAGSGEDPRFSCAASEETQSFS